MILSVLMLQEREGIWVGFFTQRIHPNKAKSDNAQIRLSPACLPQFLCLGSVLDR